MNGCQEAFGAAGKTAAAAAGGRRAVASKLTQHPRFFVSASLLLSLTLSSRLNSDVDTLFVFYRCFPGDSTFGLANCVLPWPDIAHDATAYTLVHPGARVD